MTTDIYVVKTKREKGKQKGKKRRKRTKKKYKNLH